jgi:hypothetical protein
MPAEIKKQIQFEIAHVLFVDIIGYPKLSINEQHAAGSQHAFYTSFAPARSNVRSAPQRSALSETCRLGSAESGGQITG